MLRTYALLLWILMAPALAETQGSVQLDPFIQATHGLRNCPSATPRLYTMDGCASKRTCASSAVPVAPPWRGTCEPGVQARSGN